MRIKDKLEEMKISKSTKYNIILGTIYLCLLLIPSIIIESYYKGKGGIFAIISGSLLIFFDKFILDQWLDMKELRKEEKKVNRLYTNVIDFLNYIKSDNYINNDDRYDEYVNFKIKYFTDNEKELRKYFQFHLYNGDLKQFNKRITFVEGRYAVNFRNHRPYSSSIEKKGRVPNPFSLKDNPEILNLMINEIKENIKKNFAIKIID